MVSPVAGSKPTVYYDGGCPVCSREIGFYRNRAGAETLDWVDVNGGDAAALGPGLARDAAMARMHARRADGSLVSGAAVFALIWRQMPGLRWLGRAISYPPLNWLAEGGYRLFLVVRKTWR